MGNTIVFGLKKDFNAELAKPIFDVEILTAVTALQEFNLQKVDPKHLYKMQDTPGSIGHALLKYKTGANLLLSAGHWIELSQLSVDAGHLQKVAEANYGLNNIYKEEIAQINGSNMDEGLKKGAIGKLASKFV